MKRLAAACGLMLLLAGGAIGADDDAIDPDRPDVSSSVKTVRPGRVQLESGVLFQQTRAAGEPTERRLSAEAMVRIGVTERLELRVDGERPALALNPFVTLPTAPEPIGSGKADVAVLLIASFDVPAQLALDLNAGVVAVGTSLYGRLPDVFVRAGGSIRFGR